MNENLILIIYQSLETVFSSKQISLMFPKINPLSLKNKLNYAVKTGKLLSIRKGIYAKSNYNFLEAANKIYTPSYVSLETVLEKEGIIFQKYQTIFMMSYLSRKIIVDKREIFYRKIKDDILLNKTGIYRNNNYFIASKERAFLDALFLYKNYHFDNLNQLDWNLINDIQKIYSSKSLKKRVQEYYQNHKSENVR